MNDEQQVHVISLWQPWAIMIVSASPLLTDYGAIKEFETRSWKTNVRGPILIHAAQYWNKQSKNIIESPPFNDYKEAYENMAFGAIIGSINIEEVITTEEWMEKYYSGFTNGHEKAFGNYDSGRFACRLSNPVKFDVPVKVKGMQGFWKVPIGAIDKKYHHIFENT
jgi:hypothetical protein